MATMTYEVTFEGYGGTYPYRVMVDLSAREVSDNTVKREDMEAFAAFLSKRHGDVVDPCWNYRATHP